MIAPPTHIGRYEIVERVGRGAMGVLYRGRDTVLDREVAIKVMGGDFSSEETARSRFFREAKAAARLQHRNIVTVFEFAEHEETPYIVMEFLRGGSLAARLKQEPPLTLSDKLDIVIQLCNGLEFAHGEGVVHRDVKPDNVWICEDGSVKLLDFGIAKSSASSVTSYGAVMGSPSYMSPEQVGGREVDGRSDVFSAGVVLYELLGGRKPFEADSPTAVMMKISSEPPRPLQELAPDLPSALLAAVAQTLEKDPEARYASAKDLASDLQVVKAYLDEGKDADSTVLSNDTLIVDTMDTMDALRPAAAEDGTTVRFPSVPTSSPGRRRAWLTASAAAVAAIIFAGLVATRRQSPPAPDPGGPPPTPPVVRLSVTSEPVGAAVSVDGADAGKVTPAELTVPEGHTPQLLRFTKTGYVPKELRLTDAMLKIGVAQVELQRAAAAAAAPGRVSLSGPYAFAIFEDRRKISPEAARHDLLLSGRHTLRLSAPDVLLNWVVTVDPPAGGRAPDVHPPGIGQIRVTSKPSLEICTALLGEVSLGNPPTEYRRVAAGTYTVQIKCADNTRNRQARVTVTAGRAAEENFK